MIRAEALPEYYRRFLWISIASAAAISWCIFDAQVTYPKKLAIAETYESFPQTEEGKRQWQQTAIEKGWSATIPTKSSAEVTSLIANQYILSGVAFLIGLVMFLKWYLPRGSWIEGSDKLVRNSFGSEFELDHLTGLDKRRWSEKGIAVLHFNTDGRNKRFVIDDFKYQREETGKILKYAEEKILSLTEPKNNGNSDSSTESGSETEPAEL